MDTYSTQASHAKSRVAMLLEFLHSPSEALLLVTGDPGTGKHDLMADFAKTLDSNQQVVRIEGHKNLTPEKLSGAMGKSFNIHLNMQATHRQQLEFILKTLQQQTMSALLIIEDAHSLPFATLAAITLLAINQMPGNLCLHLLLMGRPELENRIHSLIAPTQYETMPRVINIGQPAEKEEMINLRQRFDRLPINWPEFWATHRIKTLAACLLLVVFVGIYKFESQPKIVSTPIPISQPNMQIAALNTPSQPPHIVKLPPDVRLTTQNLAPHPQPSTPKPATQPVAIQTPYYALQLEAMKNKAQLEASLQNYHLAQITIEKKAVHGEDWYAAVYGHFANAKAAQDAIKQLPHDLQAQHPWVRHIG